MKTTLTFNTSNESHIVMLHHYPDVQASKEMKQVSRNDSQENEELLGERMFIVIKVPNDGTYVIDDIEMSYNDRLMTGYHIVETDDNLAMYFFDDFTFTWKMRKLERAGILTISEKIKEKDELLYFYVNARGIRQYSVNLSFLFLQLLFNGYKHITKKHEKM